MQARKAATVSVQTKASATTLISLPHPRSAAARRPGAFLLRFFVGYAHQAKSVGAVRGKVMLGTKANIASVVRLLFVIPAERRSPVFGGLLVKPDARESTA